MSAHDDLQALRAALRAAEVRLRAEISMEFRKLHAEFGVTPDSVSIAIHEVTTMGSEEREHVLGSVHLGVTL